MNTNEATNLLKSFGWFTFMDDGDRCALFKLPDRTLQIYYRLLTVVDEQYFRSTLSVTTDDFSSAYQYIGNEHRIYGKSLIGTWDGLQYHATEILETHILQASHQAIAWAKEQDLAKPLRDYAALPTNSRGALPLCHLAALALLGNVAQLTAYQSSFAAGNRLGFAPYITKDYIDRALAIAHQVHRERAQPQHSNT